MGNKRIKYCNHNGILYNLYISVIPQKVGTSGKKENSMRAISFILSSALMVFVLLTVETSYANDAPDENVKSRFTKHFNESLFDISGKAVFSVEILLDEKEYKIGKNVIGIVIHDSHDGDVEGAKITIDYRDIDTAQLLSQSPVVKEKGDGLYTAANLDLTNGGNRKLVITVKKGNLEDSVQFIFPEVLKKHRPAGKYVP